MKLNRILYGVAALAGLFFLGACVEEDIDTTQNLSVASFYPTIVMDGTEVQITGTLLDQVTEVIFPGDVSSTSVILVDKQLLKVTVPSGVSKEEGPIILKSASEEAYSRQTIRSASPKFASYIYSDNEGAATGGVLTISGSDLLLASSIKMFNDSKEVDVPAVAMVRKSNDAVKFTIPADAPIGNGINVTLGFENGFTIDLPAIDVKKGTPAGGSWVEKEIPLYEGNPVATGAWANYVMIDAADLADIMEGDKIRIYISNATGSAQGSLQCTPNWTGIAENLAYFNLTADEKKAGYYERTLTAEMIGNLSGQSLIVRGQAYTIEKVVYITTVWVSDSEDLRDPITEATIMLNDFEEHGTHNSSWDNSWSGSPVKLEFPVDEDTGNTYLYLKTSKSGDIWLVNCNHQDIGTVKDIENYVIKFDFKADEGVDASKAAMQLVLAENWMWIGAGLFPETTDGKWITISYNISDISKLTGDLKIGKNTNGIYGGTVPAGISIDNLRLDPK